MQVHHYSLFQQFLTDLHSQECGVDGHTRAAIVQGEATHSLFGRLHQGVSRVCFTETHMGQQIQVCQYLLLLPTFTFCCHGIISKQFPLVSSCEILKMKFLLSYFYDFNHSILSKRFIFGYVRKQDKVANKQILVFLIVLNILLFVPTNLHNIISRYKFTQQVSCY